MSHSEIRPRQLLTQHPGDSDVCGPRSQVERPREVNSILGTATLPLSALHPKEIPRTQLSWTSGVCLELRQENDREAGVWGPRTVLSQRLAPLCGGWNVLSSLSPSILYSLLLLLGWKEMLHLHKRRQRGRASEFASGKSTDSRR